MAAACRLSSFTHQIFVFLEEKNFDAGHVSPANISATFRARVRRGRMTRNVCARLDDLLAHMPTRHSPQFAIVSVFTHTPHARLVAVCVPQMSARAAAAAAAVSTAVGGKRKRVADDDDVSDADDAKDVGPVVTAAPVNAVRRARYRGPRRAWKAAAGDAVQRIDRRRDVYYVSVSVRLDGGPNAIADAQKCPLFKAILGAAVWDALTRVVVEPSTEPMLSLSMFETGVWSCGQAFQLPGNAFSLTDCVPKECTGCLACDELAGHTHCQLHNCGSYSDDDCEGGDDWELTVQVHAHEHRCERDFQVGTYETTRKALNRAWDETGHPVDFYWARLDFVDPLKLLETVLGVPELAAVVCKCAAEDIDTIRALGMRNFRTPCDLGTNGECEYSLHDLHQPGGCRVMQVRDGGPDDDATLVATAAPAAAVAASDS